MINRLKITRWE